MPDDGCDDCGGDIDLPMIASETWAKIAPGVVRSKREHRMGCARRCQCGMLCRRCAERRLGRRLRKSDRYTMTTGVYR